jgi:hypothetical protein
MPYGFRMKPTDPYLLAAIGWTVFVVMLIAVMGVHIAPPFSYYIWLAVWGGPLWLIEQSWADKNREERMKSNFRKCPSCGAWMAATQQVCNSCGTRL